MRRDEHRGQSASLMRVLERVAFRPGQLVELEELVDFLRLGGPAKARVANLRDDLRGLPSLR